ncbi:hypothetical protein B0H13DRAFT_2501247 [Mycena leptocephala]|nr:hypothetical protein B0H13DRAFT_2501247 [Mycena leptocephala]
MDSFNPQTTFGALQIGVLVSYVLFGVTTAQTYIYYSRFPEDSSKLKALVAFIWICELGHTLCIGHGLYVYTIIDYTHPERLLGPSPKSLGTGVFFGSMLATCVQGFFSYRLYAFSKKLHIPIICWAMSFLRQIGGIAIFGTALRPEPLAKYAERWEWLFMSFWTISIANDFMITAALVGLLFRERTNAHKRTLMLVDKLIVWTIETGMVTSASGIVSLACFLWKKDNFIWLAFFVMTSLLYANSLLASLNSRATLRAMNVNEVSLNISTPAIGPPSNSVQPTKITYDAESSCGQYKKGVPDDT